MVRKMVWELVGLELVVIVMGFLGFCKYGLGHLDPECPRTLSLAGDIRCFTQKGAESS